MSKHHALPEPATAIDMYLHDMALSLRDLVRLATPSVLGQAEAETVELREPAQPEPTEPPKPASRRKPAHRDEAREGDDVLRPERVEQAEE